MSYMTTDEWVLSTLASIIPSIDPSNLSDAYFYVAIHQSHRRFLRFVEHNTHQFAAWLFGLLAAL